MIHDLLGHEMMDYRVAQQILEMKKVYVREHNGTGEGFQAFLADQGVVASGQYITIDDSFVTLANLKQTPPN